MYLICKFESFLPNSEIMTSQHGARISQFQENSFIDVYLTSKFLLLLIFIFLSPLVHEIRVWALFWANFGFMTSPPRVKTSKFRENSLINEHFTSKYLLLLIFIFVSILGHSWLDWRHHVSQNCSILRKWSLKQNPHSSVSSNIDFDLSITLNTWYTTLGSFYPIWR